MKDTHFIAAAVYASGLADKLNDIAAEDSITKILREAEVSEIFSMIGQVKNIEKNIGLLRKRVTERKAMLKGQKS